MKELSIFILLLLPIFNLCQTNEELNIFSQIISEKIEKSKKKVVIQKETYVLTSERQKDLKYKFLKTNFKNQNKNKTVITNKFDKKLNVTLIDNKEMTELFKSHTGWDDFYKKCKNAIGIIEFSKIGFNKNKTQALFYYSKSSDFLNGHGNYIFFERKNGKWIKVLETMAWIS